MSVGFERDRSDVGRTAHWHSQADVTIVDQSLDLVDVVNECTSVDDACLSVHVHGESNE